MVGRRIERHPWPKMRVPAPKRPRIRAECYYIERPCPFVTCRYHLYSDVVRGSLKEHATDPMKMEETCALDVADERGELKLKEIAKIMNLTRERIRQIEVTALRKVRSL